MEIKLNFIEKIRVAARVFRKVIPLKEVFLLFLFTLPFTFIDFKDETPFFIQKFLMLFTGAMTYSVVRWFLYQCIWKEDLKPFIKNKFIQEKEAMQKEAVENIDKELLVK